MEYMEIEDMTFGSLLGMDRREFERKAGLMRNPEGLTKPGRCPICKKELTQNETGDLFCPGYGAGDCFWHRHSDGTNYWSEPYEMSEAMAAKDPVFKAMYDLEIRK